MKNSFVSADGVVSDSGYLSNSDNASDMGGFFDPPIENYGAQYYDISGDKDA